MITVVGVVDLIRSKVLVHRVDNIGEFSTYHVCGRL